MNYYKLYNSMPITLQNICITLYGARLYYERYLWANKNLFGDLMKSQWYSSNELESLQNSKLIALVKYAYETTEYYSELFDLMRINVKTFNGGDDIKKLPILNKENIRENYLKLRSKSIKNNDIIELYTSGSTGKSLKIGVDLDSRRMQYMFASRYHGWAGITNYRGGAIFNGRIIVPQKQTSKIFWRYNAITRCHLFSVYHMSYNNMAYYVDKLIRIKPNFIEGYPSALYTIARYINDNSIDMIKLNGILTTGETLMDHQRCEIEMAFKCKVTDQYGCTEQAMFVAQCEYGSYHVNSEYGVVELLDENGKDAESGTVGRVVCTSFMNRAIPLIRYDIGDTAIWGDTDCPCGRKYKIITNICGRIDDLIKTRDGRFIGRLDPVFKGLTSIKNAQIIQHDFDRIEVKIVPGDNYQEIDGINILSELEKRIGGDVKFELVFVPDIDKSPNGKFRAVISKISDRR